MSSTNWWAKARSEKEPTFTKISGLPAIKRSILFGNLTVSQFWLEKLLVTIDFCQLVGLMLAAGWEIWPFQWKFNSEFTLWFNIDMPYIYYTETLEEFTFRAYLIALWVVIAVVFVLLYLWLKMKQKSLLKPRVTTEKWMLLVAQILFMPLAVNLLVPGVCQFETSEDIEIEDCQGLNFEEVMVNAGAITAAFVFLSLIMCYFYYHAFVYTIHGKKRSHERYIMVKEFEHILQLSDTWRVSKLFLISSFKRSKLRIYHRANMLLLKIILVCAHAGANTDPTVKFAIFLIATTPFLVFYTLYMPYRCMTTSLLWLTTMWITVVIMMLGLFKALDFDSNMLFDANLANLLLLVLVISLSVIVLLIFTTMVLKIKWPLTMAIMKDNTIGWEYMINDFKKGQQTIEILNHMMTFRFVRQDRVESVLSALKRHYEYARDKHHFLEDSLLGVIDELSTLYSRVKEVSLLPNKNLEKHYHTFLDVCKRRHKEQLLMNPVKRRILLKLNAIRYFIGPRMFDVYKDIGEMTALQPQERRQDGGTVAEDDFAMIEEIELQGFFKPKQGMLTANNILHFDGGLRTVDSIDTSQQASRKQSYDNIDTRLAAGEKDAEGEGLLGYTNRSHGLYQVNESEDSKSLLKKIEASVSNIDDYIEMTAMILQRHELTPVESRVLRRVQMYWTKFVKDWEKSFMREFHRHPQDEDREVRIGSYLFWQNKVDEALRPKV